MAASKPETTSPTTTCGDTALEDVVEDHALQHGACSLDVSLSLEELNDSALNGAVKKVPSPVRALAQAQEFKTPVTQVVPSIGLLFPGEGSQYVKMMASAQDIPAVKEMLSTAKMVLGIDLLELCLKGPERKLGESKWCQPAMFTAGLAGLEKLRLAGREKLVERVSHVAGLSLGEYTALCAAGVFSYKDGLELVKLRGEAMQEAAQVGKQVMLSVAGINKKKLQTLVREAAQKEPNGVCVVAEELFPKGFACAGTEKAIVALENLAQNNGALQIRKLNFKGAFHSSLMKSAVVKLGAKLDAMVPKMKPPTTRIMMNTNARAVGPGSDPKEIVALLKQQLTSPVLWEQSMRNMIDEGATEFYEVGPSMQLKHMMKRIDPKIWGTTYNIDV